MKGCPNDREVDDRGGSSHRRLLRGDVEAFSGIIEQYSPRMLRLALGIVGRRDVAEDVLQDALVKAYERLGTWRGEGALSTWLYRIVYTTAVSSLRRSARDFFDSGGPAISDNTEDDGGDWEVTEASIARMRGALEQLAPLDRTLVTLFHLEDRSVRDVAAICGESESNVKTRLHRARARLRKLMEEDGKER